MVVAVASRFVDVTNSSRKLCPTPTPLGMYSQPSGTSVWVWGLRGGRREQAERAEHQRDEERDAVEAAGLCVPAGVVRAQHADPQL